MKYRVKLKVGYMEIFFEFESLMEAGEFMETVLTHMVDSEDAKRQSKVMMEVINEEVEEETE